MLKVSSISIIRTLREHGHQAYLVGGCVRDLLLGREPADYDVTTDATPKEVMRIFPQTYAVGEQFGVVLIPLPKTSFNFSQEDKTVISSEAETSQSEVSAQSRDLAFPPPNSKANTVEVATFRSDIGYTDGRHPDQVRFSKTPQEDVQRRDFTINGLLLDPISNEVLDYIGGRRDLEAQIIRTIGDPTQRFAEDKLRMLRAVRFAARFNYTIEPGTFRAIQQLAPQIHQVSRERVRDELTKMLTEGHARQALLLLSQSGLLKELLPEIEKMKGVEQPPQFHPEGDVFIHALLLLEKLPHPCPPTLAWGALLHDVGKPPTFRIAPDRIRFDGHVEVGVKMAEEICRRLRFSNDDTEQVLALVNNHMRFASVQQMKDSTFKKFVRMPRFDEHLALHRIDCLSSHGDLTSYNFIREKIASIPPEAVRPTPLITGEDLIAVGYPPGPRFKEILTAVEDAQLEGRLQSAQEALQFVRQEFPL
ncbi:MAG TPA: CCA tRNA nucleotidyltransferase [Terriglobales bacterium]|jgi:poly(A) polymerase